jgi:hypothetical protein
LGRDLEGFSRPQKKKKKKKPWRGPGREGRYSTLGEGNEGFVTTKYQLDYECTFQK